MIIITGENVFIIQSVDDFKEHLYGFMQQDALEALYNTLTSLLPKDVIIDLKDMYDSVFVTKEITLDIECIKVPTKYGRIVNIFPKYIDHVIVSQKAYKEKLNNMSITVV